MESFSAKPNKDRRAEEALAEQTQLEELRIAEEENKLAERKHRSKKKMGGLIQTSEAGGVNVKRNESNKKVKLSGVI